MHTSTFFYGLVLTYCSIVYNVMLARLVRTRAFSAGVLPKATAQTSTAYRVGLYTYAAATIVALLAPFVSFAAYVCITLYYLIPRGVDSDLA